ncbi:ABC transporter permease [Streptomyces sp. MC1]|uniref:ABC transporter permease n=1 Tax=Streptomyces sp. MC1 TaxID=295105 RepID=UPI0018C90264|nr:ABC transporter permease [Streptomyces sp. MC1]MBG7704969.1 ABC transporter permease [Streptomyces sp. MC1]
MTFIQTPPAAIAGKGRPSALRRFLRGNEVGLIAVLVILWLTLGLTYDPFLTGGNVANILREIAQIGIVGVGMTMVIITGGIDVSAGSALAVCAVLVGQSMASGHPAVVSVLIGLVAGALAGLVNGLLVAYGRIHPIIVTFGTLNLFRFISFQLAGGDWVTGLPPTLHGLGMGTLLGVPVAWWLTMALALAGGYYLRYRPTGRHLYALGNNAETARLSGVRTTRRQVAVYTVTGLLVGIAALVFVGRNGGVQTNVGTGFELQVIAAVVLGGTSVLGGKGTVLGTLLGALLVGTVRNALIITGVPALLEGLFLGLLIVVAVSVDVLRQRRRAAV